MFAGGFGSLQYVMAGAEKLPERISVGRSLDW